MSQDEEYDGSAGQEGSRPGAGETRAPGVGRLPPPAFPPGARRRQTRPNPAPTGQELGEAFISPDEPIPPRPSFPDEAFISPDGSIGGGSTDTPVAGSDGGEREPRVQVTGIGSDTHLDPFELTVSRDPYVRELVQHVSKLAEALKSLGEAGLRATPGMSRFEATLRAYCVGYLAGRRAEDGGK